MNNGISVKTRKYLYVALGLFVAAAAFTIYVVRTRDPLRAYRIGMTFDETKHLLKDSYQVLHPSRPDSTNPNIPKEQLAVAYLVRTKSGSSLYFDDAGHLMAVYTRSWYYPLPLRRWLGLGPARPAIGVDIYREEGRR